MSAPFVVTSRLGNILQMITLAHQTGILRIIRGQGATREMGQIRFISGEPVSALLGQLTGEAALGVLNNWGECYYSFDELSVADIAAATGRRSGTGELTSPYSDATLAGIAEGNPASYAPYSDPGLGPYGGAAGVRSPTGSFDMGNPSTTQYRPSANSLPSYPSPTTPMSEASWPIYSYQESGLFSSSGGQPAAARPIAAQTPFPPAATYSSPASMPATPVQLQTQGQMVTTVSLTSVPQRTALAEQVERLPLDRRERMVLLLVDGQRTVADLSRLTRRAEAEVQAVLGHLALLGLIVVSR